MADFPPRHAISRARFFLQKAQQCIERERDDCEAYLDAAIVFACAALPRFKKLEYSKHAQWKSWWDGLRSNSAVCFFRDERNCILKEAPSKVGQVIRLGGSSGLAAELYYYESPDIPATETVKRHLDEMETLILDAQRRFANPLTS